MEHSIIDNQPYGRFHRKLFFLSSGGPFLDGYILSVIGVAITGATRELELTSFLEGVVGAAALVGVLVGGFVFGWVTDRVGRQVMYTIDLIALVLASALSLFVTEAWQLIVLRFVAGIAVGADYPIATSLLAEWLPANRRGRTMGALVAAWFVGASASYAVGYLVAVVGGDGLWRWVLASATVPGVIILLARIGTPESPRWLLRHNRPDAAREAIRTAFGRCPTEQELAHLAEHEPPKKSRLSEVFRGGYLGRTLFVGGFWMCQVAPAFAIWTFYPVILGAYGFEEGNTALLWSMVVSLVTLAGCFPCIFWVESIGRRPVIIWTFVGVTVSMAALGLFPGMVATLAILMFVVNALALGGGNILQWIYPTELFPTDIRASAVGVASAISRIGAAAGTYLLPVGLDTIGLGPTMLVGAGIAAVGTAMCLAWAPETKGKALHESATVVQRSAAPATTR
ncbi:MFS transporter [Saccharopolyspora subtropica]|uniref:MFS transporter n=1 Tax=Saccharopolyspora thermophila TaxID=89367 RepID=A0A917NG67_9PSEU|nr:MFS transporter [Saccharopolyspora subtropica]GGI98741.1 MFS transporter [Saccharopolyspora subtropica]